MVDWARGWKAWQPWAMVDDVAKECLHAELQRVREALVWKLDGLSEYDIRRPLTATGTNLLGLVKHTATWKQGTSERSSTSRFRIRCPVGRIRMAATCG